MSHDDSLFKLSRRGFLASSAVAGALAVAETESAQAAARVSTPQGWAFGPFDSMRDYVRELDRRGLLLKLRNIDLDAYEGTALMYRLVDRFGMYEAPALYLENVKIDGQWMKGPVISNHYGHWDTECLVFGMSPVPGDHFATYYKAMARVEQILDKGVFPEQPYAELGAEHAPVKQVVLRGEQIDLRRFPFVWSNPGDAGRYINSGSVHTEDVELGKNFGTYRCQIKGPRTLGVNPEPNQSAWKMFMKKKERGDKLAQVAIVLGQDPIMWVVSSSKLARGKTDEYRMVSAIRGKPIELVKCETLDMLIPAHAEMVIEGEVPLDEPMQPEGPFGEMYGYMGQKKDENFWMKVTCVTHRRDPWIANIYTGVTRGFPTAPLEQLSLSTMQRFVPNVKMIHSPVEATGITIVSFRKQKAGEALEIGKRIAQIVPIAKLVVMIDDDIEALDRTQVLHAMGSRWQPQPATAIIAESRGMPLDPSLTNRPMTSKIVIDATRQWPEEGGPREYQSLNRAMLRELAPDSFAQVEANWNKWVGSWRPPGR
ncbi:MAG: UbiD family decarboxylase [Pseudomonadales bacterium]|nr:UbiD family decarboxylase [Pseudomonadales bacterium]